jgi:hypothetical protein
MHSWSQQVTATSYDTVETTNPIHFFLVLMLEVPQDYLLVNVWRVVTWMIQHANFSGLTASINAGYSEPKLGLSHSLDL